MKKFLSGQAFLPAVEEPFKTKQNKAKNKTKQLEIAPLPVRCL